MMKTKHLTDILIRQSGLITGLTVLCLAAVLAVHITLKPIPTETADEPGDPGAREGVTQRAAAGHGSTRQEPGMSPRVRGSHPSAAGRGGESTARHAAKPEFTVSVPSNHPRRETLEEQASKVARHANQALDRLSRQLDLTEAQRARLFPMLAKTSRHYNPAMIPGGTPVPAATDSGPVQDAIWELLEPAQRDEWIETSVTDMVLWREIFENLIRQLEQSAPAPADVVPAIEPPPATHPGRNLYQLNQAAE